MQQKGYIVTSNNQKRVLDCIKKSKLEKYLCFAIKSNLPKICYGKLLFVHSYECQSIKTKNPFDKILGKLG